MIDDIRLQHFRSYEDASFEFGPGVNIIVGPNGSGKTNLLEAIQVVAIGKSYRVSDAELLQFETPWFRLDAHLDRGTQSRVVKFVPVPRQTKNYELNDASYRTLKLEQTVPIVLFEPNHLFLFQGAPDLRRNYLDDIIEQITPGFATFRKQYRRVLRQRNALLKRGAASKQELFPWNLRLSELGAVIARERQQLVRLLDDELPELYALISNGKKHVRMVYDMRFPAEAYETHLLHKLESSLDHDIARGFTAYGPHREDIILTFDDHIAAEVASRGEVRTAVLALKILELERLEKARGITPILLLDDVFSELDGTRRRALTTYLQKYQTFLTTTDADVVIKHFTDSTIIPLTMP